MILLEHTLLLPSSFVVAVVVVVVVLVVVPSFVSTWSAPRLLFQCTGIRLVCCLCFVFFWFFLGFFLGGFPPGGRRGPFKDFKGIFW